MFRIPESAWEIRTFRCLVHSHLFYKLRLWSVFYDSRVINHSLIFLDFGLILQIVTATANQTIFLCTNSEASYCWNNAPSPCTKRHIKWPLLCVSLLHLVIIIIQEWSGRPCSTQLTLLFQYCQCVDNQVFIFLGVMQKTNGEAVCGDSLHWNSERSSGCGGTLSGSDRRITCNELH